MFIEFRAHLKRFQQYQILYKTKQKSITLCVKHLKDEYSWDKTHKIVQNIKWMIEEIGVKSSNDMGTYKSSNFILLWS